jgi:hypothetical protein
LELERDLAERNGRIQELEQALEKSRSEKEVLFSEARQWEKQAARGVEFQKQAGEREDALRRLSARVGDLEKEIAEGSKRFEEREAAQREAELLKGRVSELEVRVREGQETVLRERERGEALQAEAKAGERAAQELRQELAASSEKVRQAEERADQANKRAEERAEEASKRAEERVREAEALQAKTEQRLERAQVSEAKWQQELRKAVENLEAAQAARAGDARRVEAALEKEREAVSAREQMAVELRAAREALRDRPQADVDVSGPAADSHKEEVARLEARLQEIQRQRGDAERRASEAERQFAEILVDWEARKKLSETLPVLNERLAEQKEALEGWEKRGVEWADREADLRDSVEERQREIEEMRSAIRTLQRTENIHLEQSETQDSGWRRFFRQPWMPPAVLALGILVGVGVGVATGGRINTGEAPVEPGHRVVKGAVRETGTPVSTVEDPGAAGGKEEGAGPGKSEDFGKTAPPAQPVRPGGDDTAETVAAKAVKPSPKMGAGLEKEEPAEGGTPVVGKTTSTEASGGPEGKAGLPNQFLGIKFGTLLTDNPAVSQWLLDKGIYHRKAHLVGAEVEAAIVPDQENRMMKGSYVRICPRSTAEVAKFLEWSVSVQDAISAQYGEPAEVQEVKEASDAEAVVERIASGKDRYMAVWKRDTEDASIIMSIGAMNERSVVFRLEYFSAALMRTFGERAKAAEAEAAQPKPDEAPPVQ